jgi:ATP-dependent helicase/nuclease subunit A
MKAATAPRYAEAELRLERFAEWARQDTPFGFYARVLGAERGRARFLERLGHEADDALDELVNLALQYEQRETPSLQGFIAWLRAAQTDVKRDMEITRDEVRVMTVHGAKGLEAPIVVLADTTTPPAGPGPRQPRLIELNRAAPVPGHFVWAGARANDVAAVAAARERARRETEEEHRRLLYVAMTRASERLVVCGAEGERSRPEGCWWNLVAAALQPVSIERPSEDGEGKVWRFQPTAARAAAAKPSLATKPPQASKPLQQELPLPPPLPLWLAQQAPAAPPQPLPLSPSRAYDEAEVPIRRRSPGSGAERAKAIARGLLMHQLLQSLPDLPPASRLGAARAYVGRAGHDFTAEEQDELIVQVLRLLEDARFGPLFAPGSRAEVPIVGRLAAGGIAVSGQVDRLVVTETAVLIADFKTNRPAPARFADVPPAYVRQLALYRAVLSKLYPGRTVRAALIWTDVPDLMEIPAAAMDLELASVTSP